MVKCLTVFFILSLIFTGVHGQQLPAENAVLNYRLAGFSVPEKAGAASYIFEIAAGNMDEQNFNPKVIIKQKSTINHKSILLPSFGAQYTWRVEYLDKSGKQTDKSELHHFATGIIKVVDPNSNGLVVNTKATHHGDMLVMLDGVLVIYDMNGSPIWYMPDIPEIKERNVELRDFKSTHAGTFTMLTPTGAYEFDYNGKIIWTAPNDGKVSGDKTEYYHHELTRLKNGHYMVASAETIMREVPASPAVFFAEGDTSVKKESGDKYYKNITCGTLIEYDAGGNVVWRWKSSEHFTDKDYFRPLKALSSPFDGRTYLNAFEFDEKHKCIYISFKNINRVIKVAYPSGEILNSYGEHVNEDWSISSNSPFYGQHSCHADEKTNELYVYNNNCSDYKEFSASNIDEDGYICSHVAFYKQPTGKENTLHKVWDLPLRLALQKDKPQVSNRGGSVQVLADGCVLVNMGTMNHLLIAGKNKQIVWDAAPYTSDIIGNKKGLAPYRCNYILLKDIDKFLFRK